MQAKNKEAAGGVVVRKHHNGQYEILLVQHTEYKGWGFPKGHIEAGETPEQTALREVEEETGVRGEIVQDLSVTRYTFVNQKGRTIHKTVYWYLMRYAGEGVQTHAHEIQGLEWRLSEEIPDRLMFDNDRELFRRALADMDNHSW